MEAQKRKILRRAKSCFSDTEYRRFYRALKTLESNNIDLEDIYKRQEFLFDVFPEFTLLYTSLFCSHKKIPDTIVLPCLNHHHLAFYEDIQTLLDLFRSNERPSDQDLLKLLFASFSERPRLLYFFLADQYVRALHVKQYSLQQKIDYAKRIFRIASPLAKRLGIRSVREEFDNIAFSILFNDDYSHLKRQRSSYIKGDKHFLRKISDKIRYFLKKEGVSFQIYSRMKGIYSIYKKLQKKGRSEITSLNDIFAFRVLVKTVPECYSAFGVLQTHFPHVPGKIKDYISRPKPNGYQSLHTILQIDVNGVLYPFEVQIRTEEMHDVAQSGIAAHLFYKSGDDVRVDSQKVVKKKIRTLSSQFSSEEFLHQAQDDLFDRYIFVYTPKKEIIPLAKFPTVLDFAYTIHSDLGNYALGAMVNGENVGIEHVLQNGDRVEVITSDELQVLPEWEEIAFIPSVQRKIRSFFNVQ